MVRARARVAGALLVSLALASSRAAAQDDACLACHALDAGMLADGDFETSRPTDELLIDGDLFARSVHGSQVACSDCHVDREVFPHPADALTAGCEACHADQAATFATSVHGVARPGEPTLPVKCGDCHGIHDALPPSDRESRLHPLNVHRTCGQCHFGLDPRTASVDQLMRLPYMDDVHGEGILRAGLAVSATCVSCHGGHEVRAKGDPASRVARIRVEETCGECHVGVLEQYRGSVHHEAVARGELAASCTDCHQPHAMSHPSEAFRSGLVQTCGDCHMEQASSYADTFHGKAWRLGSSTAARCQDCHGSHAMLRPSDPASTLGPENVATTCGQCHADANAGFGGYDPHAVPHDPTRHPGLHWTWRIMTALLVGTLAVALLHSLLWLFRLVRTRSEWAAHKAALRRPATGRVFLRFTAFQRIQHLVLVLAFFDLVLTGMALKFSFSGWAQRVAALLGGPEWMRVLHRAGAILLLGVFVLHVASLLFARRRPRRSWRALLTGPDSLMFNRADLQQFRQMLRWFAGRGPRPRFDRYSYWEKFDYMAVFWGVAVIGLSGLMLWFPGLTTRALPGQVLNFASLVHGDEALLAALFIFTVHFFNSHFRPDKFPLDPVMFTGRMRLAEMEREKPLELERLQASGELESRLVEPYPEQIERPLRRFGYVALGIGVALDLMIAWALLTGGG